MSLSAVPADLGEASAPPQRYAAEGADMLFIEAPHSVAEIDRIAEEVDASLLFNVVPGGKPPGISDEGLARLEFRLAIYPGAVLAPVASAAVHALSRMSARPAGDLVGPASSAPSGSTNGPNSTSATARGHNTKGDRHGHDHDRKDPSASPGTRAGLG